MYNAQSPAKSQAIAPFGSAGRVLCGTFFVLARDSKAYGDAGQVWSDGLVFAACESTFRAVRTALTTFALRSLHAH